MSEPKEITDARARINTLMDRLPPGATQSHAWETMFFLEQAIHCLHQAGTAHALARAERKANEKKRQELTDRIRREK